MNDSIRPTIEKPTVSVIIPAYNAEKTLERCLGSVTEQTLSNIEIIVVDDGSEDNTATIAEAHTIHDQRIRIINQANQGQGAARNVGVSEARGAFLAFIDSDDIIESNMLEIMVDAAQSNNAEIATCQADNLLYRNDRLSKKIGSFTLPGDMPVISGAQAADWVFDFVAPNMNSMCFKVVSRELFMKSGIRFPENKRFAEDMPTSVGLLLNAERVALVRQDLYHYIREGESFSTGCSPKNALDIMLDLEEILSYAENANHQRSFDAFALGMCFTAEKQLAWTSKDADRTMVAKAQKAIGQQKAGRKPDRTLPLPLSQRAKVQLAYHNLTTPVCTLIAKLKWIPFVKYLV